MQSIYFQFLSPSKWAFYLKYFIREPKKALLRAKFKCVQLFFPYQPSWAPGAISVLADTIQPDWMVGEYGSGRSSIWLAKRAKEVWSIEDNLGWLEYLEQIRVRKKIGNLHLVKPQGPTAQDYVSALSSAIGEKKLDLLIIDGKYRQECAVSARTLVKPGGYILFDDTMRLEYRECLNLMGKRVGRFSNEIRMTDIYKYFREEVQIGSV